MMDGDDEDAGWRREGWNKSLINFARGQPHPSLMPPVDFFVRSLHDSEAQYGLDRLLQYGTADGTQAFRRALGAFIAAEMGTGGSPIPADQFFVTSGSSSALAFVAAHLANPGDLVVVEEPVYWLALTTLRQSRLRLLGVASDPEVGGIDLDALERLLEEGSRPRLLYCVPCHHNPTGRTMPLDKRKRLVRLAHQYHFLVICDDVYPFLGWKNGNRPLPMLVDLDDCAELEQEDCASPYGVISIGTFSKLLAPSLRLGWLQVHASQTRALLGPLRKAGVVNSGGCLNQFVAQMLLPALQDGRVSEHVARVRQRYRALCDALCRALDQRLVEAGLVRYHRPNGGYFVWVELLPAASTTDSRELHQMALAKGVKIAHGDMFAVDPSAGQYRRFFRLSFAHQTEKDIEEGVERIAIVLSNKDKI